jgi:hypothetical protein
MAFSYARATRCARAAVVFTLLAGSAMLVREARRLYVSSSESGDLITTSKSTVEKKTTAKGTEGSEKHEITTAPNPNLTDRILGQAGLWVARVIMVLLAAFLAGALVQRTLLGKFAFKAGGLELPEVQAPPAALSQSLADAFQQGGEAVPSHAGQRASITFPLSVDKSSILFSGYTTGVLDGILQEGSADYSVIDLGDGNSWLTTRLFVLAILLRRMQSVKTIVFVETRGGVDKRYLGVRSPDAVHWLLAHEYPWMERSFADAYSKVPQLKILSESGALDTMAAGILVEGFFQHPSIQSQNPDSDLQNWVQMPGRWEHARWISGTLATELFNLSPVTTSFVDLGENRNAENTFAELAAEGSFVALVDERRRFLKLLDREGLLEKLAAEARLKFAMAITYDQA